jgi:hypothetical protein
MNRQIKWFMGSISIVVIVYFVSRSFYFKTEEFMWLSLNAPSNFESVYFPVWWKAQICYLSSLFSVCYAAYIMVTLLSQDSKIKFSSKRAAVHLAIWTLAPPLWFSLERYFFYAPVSGACPADIKAGIEALKEGQEYASKFWAAILAVMLAFQLGEVFKKTAASGDEGGGQ